MKELEKKIQELMTISIKELNCNLTICSKEDVLIISPPFCLGKEVSLARLSPFTLSPNVKGGFVALLINKLCKKVLNSQKSI